MGLLETKSGQVARTPREQLSSVRGPLQASSAVVFLNRIDYHGKNQTVHFLG